MAGSFRGSRAHQGMRVDDDRRLPKQRKHPDGGVEGRMRRRIQECLQERMTLDESLDGAVEQEGHVADAVAVGVEALVLAPRVSDAAARPVDSGGELPSERANIG